jgi:hypothetical protein
MIRLRPHAAGLALLLCACNSEQPNPFQNSSPIVAPKASNAIVFTSNLWSGRAGGPREVYGVDQDGANLTRVTFCNSQASSCDNEEAVPSPDGQRYATRRVVNDANGDGRLTAEDGEGLFILDPKQAQEGPLTLRVASTSSLPTVIKRVSGVDWSPTGDVLVFSAEGQGGPDDLYRTVPRPDTDLSQTLALSDTSDVRERRPRMNPNGAYAAYERADASSRSEVWLFQSQVQQAQVTAGGPSGPLLPGGSYAVGSDADPDFSPDGASVVFRRLTGTGSGTGTWDLYAVRTGDGSSPALIAGGPIFRGAPDWGLSGIAFVETDANGSRLVTMKSDGSERRVILTVAAGLEISAPRWRR